MDGQREVDSQNHQEQEDAFVEERDLDAAGGGDVAGTIDKSTPLDSGGTDTEDDEAALSDSVESKAPMEGSFSRRVPSWVKIALGAVLIACVLGIGLFAWHESRFAKVPNVIGNTPSEAITTIESISGNWEIKLSSPDDLSGLSDEDLNEKYEVVDIDPDIGERLSKDDSYDISIVLKKNNETVMREYLIQREVLDVRLTGWADKTYVDEGDVVTFKFVNPEPTFRSDGS